MSPIDKISDIRRMPRGKELDALVAEKVMGHPMPDFIPEDALDLYLAGTPIHYDSWTCVCVYDEGDIPKWVPDPYSTDIAAAWPIAVKMGLGLFPLNNKDWACCKASHIYHVEIGQDHYADPNLVICREAPEAICRASLLAVAQELRKAGNKLDLDLSLIKQLYLEKALTGEQIAKRLGCSSIAIYSRLKQLGITRSRSAATRIQLKGRHPGNWKGGRYQEDNGYIYIYLCLDDPYRSMADKRGYIREHRLVIAKHLGRCLERWEVVHHKGTKYPQGSKEDKSDNRLENLDLMPSQAEHLPSIQMQEEVIKLRRRVTELESELKICKRL